MDKRAFLAIALSLVILLVWQEWMSRYYAPPPRPPETPAQREAAKFPPTTPPRAVPSPIPAQEVPVAAPTVQPAKDVVVETDDYKAVFTTRGARLKSLKFKHYRTTADRESQLYELIASAPDVPLPLGLRWSATAPVNDAGLIYTVAGGNLRLTRDSKGTLAFKAQAPDGSLVSKTFTFFGSGYQIHIETSVRSSMGNETAQAILFTEKSDQAQHDPGAPFEGLIALVDGKIKREYSVEPNNTLEYIGDIAWAGFGHTYFFFALIPENGAQHRLTLSHSGSSLTAALNAPASNTPQRYTLFAGPKDLETLEAVGKGIERSIDFGYFAFIAIPFLYVLHFSHRFTASYGVDIILLTIILKLLMAPLTHKSFVSMKAMGKLAPQMERLKERYKNEKEKLNKEIMELYRRNGVNPLGGCLPMVLQFPVFIGLYNALSTPIELRHASFMWIKDLSQPDWKSLPFTMGGWDLGIPVLTILMGASMFIQQWMTPSAGDPNQRRMMLMMPLIFTFMFVTFPAGLTIYWLVNNVLSIAQQYWINSRDK